MKLFFAYLDAGTGSVIIQAVIGGVVAVGVFVKTFWHKLTKPFRRGANSSDHKKANSAE